MTIAKNEQIDRLEKNAISTLLSDKKSSGRVGCVYISAMERIDTHTICVTFNTIRSANIIVRGADLSWLPQY